MECDISPSCHGPEGYYPLLPISPMKSPVFTYSIFSSFLKFEFIISLGFLITWSEKLEGAIELVQILSSLIQNILDLYGLSDGWTQRCETTIRAKLTASKWNLINETVLKNISDNSLSYIFVAHSSQVRKGSTERFEVSRILQNSLEAMWVLLKHSKIEHWRAGMDSFLEWSSN